MIGSRGQNQPITESIWTRQIGACVVSGSTANNISRCLGIYFSHVDAERARNVGCIFLSSGLDRELTQIIWKGRPYSFPNRQHVSSSLDQIPNRVVTPMFK